jgi:cAMP phosphodiesterase
LQRTVKIKIHAFIISHAGLDAVGGISIKNTDDSQEQALI